MNDETPKRLGDIVKSGTQEQVSKNLQKIRTDLEDLAIQIGAKLEVNERNFLLRNLLSYSATQMGRLERWLPDSAELLAWCSRNLFEANLLLRSLVVNEENVRRIANEVASDEIEVLEGIIGLNPSAPEARDLENRIEQIKRIAKADGRMLLKPKTVSDLAKSVGIGTLAEYKAFFKFYSKYVHPSSWLLNASPRRVESEVFREVFLVRAQLYAADTYARARLATGL